MTKRVNVLNLGDKAPDFTLTATSGHEVSLSNYRGKRVALFFWASW